MAVPGIALVIMLILVAMLLARARMGGSNTSEGGHLVKQTGRYPVTVRGWEKKSVNEMKKSWTEYIEDLEREEDEATADMIVDQIARTKFNADEMAQQRWRITKIGSAERREDPRKLLPNDEYDRLVGAAQLMTVLEADRRLRGEVDRALKIVQHVLGNGVPVSKHEEFWRKVRAPARIAIKQLLVGDELNIRI